MKRRYRMSVTELRCAIRGGWKVYPQGEEVPHAGRVPLGQVGLACYKGGAYKYFFFNASERAQQLAREIYERTKEE